MLKEDESHQHDGRRDHSLNNVFNTILLLGGTGSLGHALTSFLLATTDATIRIFSRDELKQSLMHETFALHDEKMRYFLGDIRDLARLNLACSGVDLVVHAAALKRIEKGEVDPCEFIATNVHGTANVISACRTMGVKRAVFIGSDKQVDPVNVYGATKLLAERLWTQSNGYSPYGTEYINVRYGNVGASRGSVIPLWQSQRAAGHPMTITDTRMTRFHLDLDAAVQLVWFAACHGPRGAVLVPHIPAFHIMDLLHAVCGQGRNQDVKVIGIRPGEKLHESLMSDEEASRALWHAPYYAIPPLAASWETDRRWQTWEPAGLVPPYRSDVWKDRLSCAQLTEMIAKVEQA